MSRLKWLKPGNKLFESGLDRGVLYPQHNPEGVPWDGLVSVNEARSGGEPKEIYVDGVKVATVPKRDDFSGSIEAYMYPDEFAACDGTLSGAPGFYLTQQRLRPFSLSYRTAIGNDLSGPNHGYKIHFIYNMIARSKGLIRSSRSQSIDPIVFGWDFSTTPVLFGTEFMPTAHVFIDSRTVNQRILSIIEDIIYGSPTTAPRLPSIEEFIEMFGSDVFEVGDEGDKGLRPVFEGDENDLIGQLDKGTYRIPPGSRLKAVKPGRYILED